MTITDTFLILATFVGPIAAVQAQKWIERSRETRNRKLWIFHTLMSTRALRASSPEHVQALNSIDLVFNARKKGDKPIIDAWGEYLDHLNHYPDNSDAKAIQTWNIKGEDFLIELLKKIGDRLGYSFTSVQLKRGIYYPRGHSDLISSQIALRDMIVKLSAGTWHFPVAVHEFPVSDDAMKLQAAVQNALLEALSGKSPLKVSVAPTMKEDH
jgi:hypothetical protein